MFSLKHSAAVDQGAKTMRLSGCIFDFDGTLFDSMCIWDTAGSDYLRSIGVVPAADVKERMSTTSLYQAAVYMKTDYALPLSIEEIMDGINKTVENFYFHSAQPKPMLRPFLDRLRSCGVKLCIATATDRYQIEAALCRCGLDGYFSEIFTCSDVGHGKDEPHIFAAALAHLGTPKSETYVFEDALYAAKTAVDAGFPLIAVYDSHETQQQTLRSLASFCLPDFDNTAAFFSHFTFPKL